MIHHKYLKICLLFFLTGLLAFSLFQNVEAQDSDNDGIPDSKESQLRMLYAPYLHFADGERFFPTEISYHIDNSALFLKSDDTNTLIDSSPTITGISSYQSEDYFLNNTLGKFEEIVNDYESKKTSLGYTVYSRVVADAGNLVVQYWFFYAYNPGINQHQGDWEMIEIILDSTETPLYAVYSQHFAGERASWNDAEKAEQTHPRVYVALGSHANYFKPYQGKLGLESDIVGDAFILGPDDYDIIPLGELGDGNWLDYGGRWGDWARIVDATFGAAGPKGPGHDENMLKWYSPVDWGMDKHAVDQTWFTLSWFAFYFIYIIAVIIIVLASIKIWRIVKRKREGKLSFMKIMRSRSGIGLVLGVLGLVIYLLALLLPWYAVRGNIQTTLLETVGETDLVLIDGVSGLRINTMQSDQGLAQLFGLGIPFSIILLTSVVLSALDIIGVEKAKKLSRTYIISGITTLIPVIIILIFILQLSGLITPLANAVAGGVEIPPQIDEMAKRMSASPIMGEYSGTIEDYGNIYIIWGLALGSYMFIVAAVLKIIGGILLRKGSE